MVTTTEISFLALVLEADPEHYERDIGYEFNNGERKFEEGDGPYASE